MRLRHLFCCQIYFSAIHKNPNANFPTRVRVTHFTHTRWRIFLKSLTWLIGYALGCKQKLKMFSEQVCRGDQSFRNISESQNIEHLGISFVSFLKSFIDLLISQRHECVDLYIFATSSFVLPQELPPIF